MALLLSSLLGAAVAAIVGVELRDRPVELTDIVGLEQTSYAKRTDFLIVAAWAVASTTTALCLLLSRRLRRWFRTIAAGPSVSQGLAAAIVVSAPLVAGLFGDARTAVITVLALAVALPTWYGLIRSGVARPHMVLASMLVMWLAVAATLLVVANAVGDAIARPVARLGFAGCVTLALGTLAPVAAGVLRHERPERLLGRALLGAQAVLPLSLLVLAVPELTAPAPRWYSWCVVSLVLGLAGAAVRRGWRLWLDVTVVRALDARSAVLAAAALSALMTLPPIVPLEDEFHTGELLIQWDQIFTHGLVPFRNFYPAPGLSGLYYGAFNEVLGGQAATFGLAKQLGTTLLGASLMLASARLLGAARALLLAPTAAALAGGFTDRLALVALGLVVLAEPRLWRLRWSWLGAWVILACANVLFITGSGVAFVAATAPFALLRLLRRPESPTQELLQQHPDDRHERVRAAALVGVSVIVVVLLSPIVVAALAHAAAEAKGNDVAWGLPLLAPQYSVDVIRNVAIDAYRTQAWWFGLPLLVAFLVSQPRRWWRHRSPEIELAGGAALVLVVLTPYAFGRIDSGVLSRLGMLTLFLVGFILPLILLSSRFSSGSPRRDTLAVSLVLAVGAATVLPGSTSGVARLLHVDEVDPEIVVGEHIALDGLGTVATTAAEWTGDRAGVLHATLAPGETFLDLTNNQAFYHYSGRVLPTPYGAFVYAASETSQEAMVAALEVEPPKVVLLGDETTRFPGVLGNPGLRAYRVVRWLWESGYRPYREDGALVLLHPVVRRQVSPSRLLPVGSREADELLVDPHITEVLSAWGRNYERMKDRFVAIGEPGPATAILLPPDFLLLDLSCRAPQTSVRLHWSSDLSDDGVELVVASGRSLVPLGAIPSWYFASRRSVEVAIPSGCELRGKELLRLVD